MPGMETPSWRGTISMSGPSTFIEKNVTLGDLGVESVASSKVYADLSLSLYVSLYLCIFVSMYLPIYLSIYLSIYPSIHPSIHLHLSVYLSVCIAGNIFCLPKTKHLRVIELFCAGGCLDMFRLFSQLFAQEPEQLGIYGGL